MKILVLDDDESRLKEFQKRLIGHEVILARNADECIEYLKMEHPFDWGFLDHDLGGYVYQESCKGTGYEVAEWIANNNLFRPDNIVIHSLNVPGSQKMKEVLGGDVKCIPFAWMKIQT